MGAYKESKIKSIINKKTHQKNKMTNNNKKQVYVAPAVEANVVNVENGFSCSTYCDDFNASIIEKYTDLSVNYL